MSCGHHQSAKLSVNGKQFCVLCHQGRKRPALTGLGDVIAAATKAVGIKPCSGCKQRQAKLNRLFPFGSPQTPAAPDGQLSDQK